jgi:general secretion pathway protein D
MGVIMNKFLTAILAILIISSISLNAKKKIFITDGDDIVYIDFKDLKIIDLIKISSKILDKNILLSQNINGKVDFVKTKPVRKKELVDILISVLDNKGFTLVGDENTLKIVRSTEASKSRIPIIFEDNSSNNMQQFVTEFIDIKKENVDVISSKIKHIASRYGKVITNRNTNTLIITDYPQNIRLVKKAIKLLERGLNKKLVTIPIKNVSLNSMSSEVQKIARSLFGSGVLENQVTIMTNKDIQSLILIGSEKNLDYLEKHIRRVDSEANKETEKTTEVIYLQNADAKNILKIMSPIVNKKRYKNSADKPYIGADDKSNRILLVGPPRELRPIKNLIKKLDVSQQQVYVKAQIIEINKKKSDSMGVKYGVEGGAITGTGLFSFSANTGGKSIASSVLSKSIDSSSKSGAIIGASIDFLVDNSAAKIVSEPSISCINNQESTIKVAETISIITSSSSTTTTTKNNFKREDIGITLKVKPRISSDQKVTLTINAIIQDVLEGTGGTGSPTTTKREVKTAAIVNHGESVIVGGLTRKRQSKGRGGIPFLSDLPLIGYLFSSKQDIEDNINLVIILTPYIIAKGSSLSDLREELSELEVLRKAYLNEIKKNYDNTIENLKEDYEDLEL